MPNIFQRIGQAARGIFKGGGKAQSPLGVFKSEQERLQAEAVVERMGELAKQAAEKEGMGRRHADVAKARRENAKARGDKNAERMAREEELKAIEFAMRQRQDRLGYERAENEARLRAEKALVDTEKNKAKAREALLKTRQNISDEDFEAAFEGPRPKDPKVYRNRKSGRGDLPSELYFLKLGFRYSVFASSNVNALQFDPRTQDLFVQYIRRRGKHVWYKYPGVGESLAQWSYQAASKGVFTWDALRIRGTRDGERVASERYVSPPLDLPLDPESSANIFGQFGGF